MSTALPLATPELCARLFLEASKDFAMFLLDTQGKVVLWNVGAAEIFGYPAADILGQPFGLLFTPEDQKNGEPEQELHEAQATGKAADRRWHRRKNGTRFWADGVLRAVHDAQGQVLGYAKVLHDIGERKELEDGLMEQVEKLAEASKQKDEFMVLLGHELRNPLAPILNALHIIRQENNADAQLQARSIVERQVHILAKLVDDLLDITCLQRGKVQLHKQRVNLSNIIHRALEATQPVIEERKQNLSVLFPDQPLWLEGDAARLEQAVTNLLHNASMFTDVGGGIWLSAERDGARALLRVRDAGVGIDPRSLPTIFDPFRQTRRTMDRAECGLGIGLAIVKQVVELHGGTVEARSEGLHMGSEFTVRLPLPNNREHFHSDRSAAGGEAQNGGIRVLIVEDNIDSANSLAMVLGLGGYNVSVQNSGLKGLETALSFQPHVAIIDIGLPELDGWQVARRLHYQLRDQEPLLIALSGYGDEEDRHKSLQAGFHHHLTKPVSPEELLSMLQDALKSRQKYANK